MSGKDLFEGMSYVDERFVDEAENRAFPKPSVSPWIKAASMAACLCLVLFSLYHLRPYLNRGYTEGGWDAAADNMAGNSADHGLVQNSQESAIASPGNDPTGEVPSVILYVEEMTAAGFTGTVAELTDADVFEVGMELNAVIVSDTRHETQYGNSSVSADSKIDYSGSCVMVQFIEYDRESKTIIVNSIREVQKEG